jgi:hypothetical protein
VPEWPGGAGEGPSEASSGIGSVIIDKAIIDSVEIFARSSFWKNGAGLVHLIATQPEVRALPAVGFVSPLRQTARWLLFRQTVSADRRGRRGTCGVIAARHLDRWVRIRREGADRPALSAQIFRFVSFAVRSPRG